MSGGRLPDPGLGAVCARCGDPRQAHGGPKHYGACPDQSGLRAARFRLQEVDKPPRPLPVAEPASRAVDIIWRDLILGDEYPADSLVSCSLCGGAVERDDAARHQVWHAALAWVVGGRLAR